MRLWITRAEPDASRQARSLGELGHEVILEPLLAIRFFDDEPIKLDGVQALIATSRNGLRALKRRPILEDARKLPIFVVGPASAELARQMGFSAVHEGTGTAEGLLDTIHAGSRQDGGSLLHLAGANLASDLRGNLERDGFQVVQPALYRAEPTSQLSSGLRQEIAGNSVDGVILMSPRTAKVYMTVMREGGLVEAARQLHHYCLSEAVADRLDPTDGRPISVAARPREQDLMMLLDGKSAD